MMRARLCLHIPEVSILFGAPRRQGFRHRNDALVGFNGAAFNEPGESRVGPATERDVIHVIVPRGRHRRLMRVVRESAFEIHDVVVIFAGGEVFAPATRYHFAADSRRCNVDLACGRRAIRKVEFRSCSKNVLAGSVEAESWGER
jgi:hypothetical protein